MRAKQDGICIWVFGMNIMNDNSANVIWGVRKMNVFQHSGTQHSESNLHIFRRLILSTMIFTFDIRMRYHLIGKLLLLSTCLRLPCKCVDVWMHCVASLSNHFHILYIVFLQHKYIFSRIAHSDHERNRCKEFKYIFRTWKLCAREMYGAMFSCICAHLIVCLVFVLVSTGFFSPIFLRLRLAHIRFQSQSFGVAKCVTLLAAHTQCNVKLKQRNKHQKKREEKHKSKDLTVNLIYITLMNKHRNGKSRQQN